MSRKRPLFPRLALIALGLSISTASCGDRERADFAAVLALRGRQVCHAAIEGYRDLEAQARQDRELQDLVRILTRPDPVTLQDSRPPLDLSRQLEPRIEAFAQLREAFIELQRLAEDDLPAEVTRRLEGTIANLGAVSALPGLPPPLGNEFLSLAQRLAEGLRARRLREAAAAFAGLVSSYRRLWESDLPTWRDFLGRIGDDFAGGLESVPADRFDKARLARWLDAPFSHSVNVAIYKQRRRRQVSESAERTFRILSLVSQALASLESAQVELAKGRWSRPAAHEALSSLTRIIEQLDKSIAGGVE